eukprot:scaffold75167_cov19-Tisochrysis_lutea.AAC.3
MKTNHASSGSPAAAPAGRPAEAGSTAAPAACYRERNPHAGPDHVLGCPCPAAPASSCPFTSTQEQGQGVYVCNVSIQSQVAASPSPPHSPISTHKQGQYTYVWCNGFVRPHSEARQDAPTLSLS